MVLGADPLVTELIIGGGVGVGLFGLVFFMAGQGVGGDDDDLGAFNQRPGTATRPSQAAPKKKMKKKSAGKGGRPSKVFDTSHNRDPGQFLLDFRRIVLAFLLNLEFVQWSLNVPTSSCHMLTSCQQTGSLVSSDAAIDSIVRRNGRQ
eukprot:g64746.t1